MVTRTFAVWVSGVKLVLDIAWWLVLAGTAVALVLVEFTAAGHGSLRISVPVSLSLQPATYRIGSADDGAALSDAAARLSLHGSTLADLVALGLLLVGAGVVLLVLHELRQLLRALRSGVPFAAANARRVTAVGVAVVAGELLRATVLFAGSWWAAHHLRTVGVGLRVAFPVRVEVLLAGVLIVVFAQVFRFGAALQQENDLTI
jgi:hypothetical protein